MSLTDGASLTRRFFLSKFNMTVMVSRMKVSKSKLIGWMAVCVCLSLLLPNHYSPWATAHQDWTMAMAIVPLTLWYTGRDNPRLPVLAVMSWAVALVPLLQFAWGKIFLGGDAWVATLYLAGFGFAIASGAQYVTSQQEEADLGELTPIVMAFVLACLVSMGIALHQWLDLQLLAIFIIDLPPQTRVFANLAQPNQFATLLLLGLAGLVFLFEKGKVGKATALIASTFIVFGLVMTGSRSVLLSMGWFWIWYLSMRRKSGLRLSPSVAVAISLFYFAAAFAWPTLNEILLLDNSTDAAVNRLTASVRTIYWQSMLEAITRAPWFGYGWNQIPFAQHAVALDYPATHNFFESAHNIVLDIVLWNGIPVGIAIVVVFVIWLTRQYQLAQDPLSWALLLGIGFVLCHSLVEFPLYYAYFLIPFGFFVGALSAKQKSIFERLGLPRRRYVRIGLAGAMAGTLALLTAVSVEYPRFEDDWREMRFAEQKMGEHEHYVPPKAFVLTQLGELLRLTRTEAAPGMSQEQLEWMDRVSSRYGYSSALYNYAVAQGINGKPEGAVHTLQMLCSLHPKRTCSVAREDWDSLGKKKWPQLMLIKFPAGPAGK